MSNFDTNRRKSTAENKDISTHSSVLANSSNNSKNINDNSLCLGHRQKINNQNNNNSTLF